MPSDLGVAAPVPADVSRIKGEAARGVSSTPVKGGHPSPSRSTSVGSSGRISSEDCSPVHSGATVAGAVGTSYDTEAQGLPTYDYPSGFVVKNTFIDTPAGGFTSFLGSTYREREIQSCPDVPPGFHQAQEVGPPPGFEDKTEPKSTISCTGSGADGQAAVTETPPASACDDVAVLEQKVRKLQEENRQLKAQFQTTGTPAQQLSDAPGVPVQASAALPVAPATFTVGVGPILPAPVEWAPAPLPEVMPPPPPSVSAEDCLRPRVLQIASALPEPMLGSPMPMWPSMGSAGHLQGMCKPCAHFHKRGCANGPQCTFCHLCPPGEIKRRQSQKKGQKRY